ncbi:hypothetical protein GDO81_003178 [Engystomops pustulosus]|uniref:RanBP2-type domain-containing protein n=1 Tax=Engystomops pustulosus TaxID=76066 RepID=A0AAV7A2Y2_ENGPU|nr:hypothetical protein GDO81_003178 [Engystomops pustulosus]
MGLIFSKSRKGAGKVIPKITMKDLVKVEHGKWAIKNAKTILKRAGMPPVGCLDANRWKRFLKEEKDWIDRHGYRMQVQAWLTTSMRHDPLYNTQDDEEEYRVKNFCSDALRYGRYHVGVPTPRTPIVPGQASSGIYPDLSPLMDWGHHSSSTEYGDMTALERANMGPPAYTSTATWAWRHSNPSSPSSPSFQGGEQGWRCGYCQYCNFEQANRCERCKTPKSEFASVCWRLNSFPSNSPVSPVGVSTPYTLTRPRLLTKILRDGESWSAHSINGRGERSNVVEEPNKDKMNLRSATWVCKCGTVHTHETSPGCSTCGQQTPRGVAAFPVITQRTTEGESTDTVQRITWYKPWTQGEQLIMVDKLPDPYKNPNGFYKNMERIRLTYDAAWVDLYSLCSAAAGFPFVDRITSVPVTGINGIEEVPVNGNERLSKSGEMFMKRLKIVTKEIFSQSGIGLPEAFQFSDESVDKYHARLVSIFVDQDFNVSQSDGRDGRILRTCFINGLREELKTELLRIRPE